MHTQWQQINQTDVPPPNTVQTGTGNGVPSSTRVIGVGCDVLNARELKLD